ncbi:MAG TPA: GNAT family N-acetyltransferase [Chitinophagaceae bacterium]|nr:GNAT family N-acetyltransferase [Chitinophagaceae bacterium]
MSHVLDNMIWNAITTGNKDIAVVDDDAGFYRADIAPFAALREINQKNFDKLYEMVQPGRSIAVSFLDAVSTDENKWKLIQHMDVSQMVYENPVSDFTTKASELIVPLSDEHIPRMLELTALTRPGPFLQNTILFGNYFGIFVDDRLAAMSGQRMHPLPYLEVSAVCTHPDFRGRGYAKALMLHVMKLILDRSFIPFLHVLTSNTGAISLYESIGYTTRKKLFIDVIRKQ